jgi:hypothetical protein
VLFGAVVNDGANVKAFVVPLYPVMVAVWPTPVPPVIFSV